MQATRYPGIDIHARRRPRSLRVHVLRFTVAGLCGSVARARVGRDVDPTLLAEPAATVGDQLLNFGPAWPGDTFIFGSRRPGWPDKVVNGSTVDRWLRTVQETYGIRNVLCLLGNEHLQIYETASEATGECLTGQTCEPELIRRYRTVFGAPRVHWHPATDFDIMSDEQASQPLLPAS